MIHGLKPGDMEIVAKGVLAARHFAERQEGNTGAHVRMALAAVADALEVVLRHLTNEVSKERGQ